MRDLHPDLASLIRIGEAASDVILEIYRQDFTVEFKKGREPVTRADKAANQLITRRLREQFADDHFLTEEEGHEAPAGTRGERVWFVDPIDGTKEFIKKNGEFAIQIGLTCRGSLELGLLLQPVGGRLWVGARGQGCWQRDEGGHWHQVTVPARLPGDVVAAMSRSHPSSLARKVQDRLQLPHREYLHGSVGLKLMAIAAGHAHFYLNDSNSTKAWDIAGPEIAFTEAGGVVSDLRGRPFAYDPRDPFHRHGMLATCDRELHERILGLIGR